MTSIYWFRKALRVHDNEGLFECAKQSSKVLPIFILDPHFVSEAKVGVNRWIFLKEALSDLDESLRKLGSQLIVLRGNPETVFEQLFKSSSIDALYYELDTEPYAKMRDSNIQTLASNSNVKVKSFIGHTLFDTQKTIERNKGTAPMNYRKFCDLISNQKIPDCIPTPTSFPPIDSDLLKQFCSSFTDSNGQFNPPTVKELTGKEEIQQKFTKHIGGEKEALKRLQEFMAQKERVLKFEKPKTSPAAFQPASTTVLSPYLKFGCLSARKFYHELMTVLKTSKVHSQPPVSLLGQLYWREFFYTASDCYPNFHQIKGNKICIQIPWGLRNDKPALPEDQKLFDAWKNAQTGYPWIDAIMTQLRQEGWIHHLARHAVACFLTRGDLYISWERGQEVFEELLLDADYALNAGNWMWLSASAFFHQYFRVYSPISFGRQYDPDGKYIKRYLPQLKNVPKKFIYEPWTMPIEIQKQVNCIIGKDYPKPIVDHDVVRKENIEKMKFAYSKHIMGDQDGSSLLEGQQNEDSQVISDQVDNKRKSSNDTKSTKKRQKKITDFQA